MSFFKRFRRSKKKASDDAYRRFTFSLTIHSLSSLHLKEDSSYAICSQRGRKISQTNFEKPDDVNAECIDFHNSVLSFETSLKLADKDNLQSAKSKSVRLTVLEQSTSKQKQAVKVKQDLAQFIHADGFKKTITFPLKKWKSNSDAKLLLTIESKEVQGAKNDAPTASEMSTAGAIDSYQENDPIDQQDEEEANKDPAVSEMVGSPKADTDKSKHDSVAANQSESATSPADIANLDKVAQLVTTDYNVLKALYTIIPDSETGQMAQVLTELSRGIGSTIRFLDCLLKVEFKYCGETQSQILRLNSFVTKCIDRIIKVTAKTYMKQHLTPIIEELMQDDEADFEIDPQKFPGKSSTEVDELIQYHSSQIQEWSRKFADALFTQSNAQSLPSSVRHMARFLRDRCESSTLPTNRILGHLLVLRMMNPAISLPYTKGILSQEPNEKQKNNLIMISKVFQHISNNTKFNENQSCAEDLNEVVEEYYDACDEFLAASCSSTADFDTDIYKADKKMTAAVHKQSVSNSVDMKLNAKFVIEAILKRKDTFMEKYKCNEQELDQMLHSGEPVHTDPTETIKVDATSVRRLFKKKKWTTAKSTLQSLDTKYANTDEKIRFELTVLWATLFNNRCLHYARQGNAKKAVTYAQDALSYLLRHDKSMYTERDLGYVYHMIYFNTHTSLASYYYSEGDMDRAVECLSKAQDSFEDASFRSQLLPDVLQMWLLQAIRIYSWDLSTSEGKVDGEVPACKRLADLGSLAQDGCSEKVTQLLSQFAQVA